MVAVVVTIVVCVVATVVVSKLTHGKQWVLSLMLAASLIALITVLVVVHQKGVNNWKAGCLSTPGQTIRAIKPAGKAGWEFGCYAADGKLIDTRIAAGDKNGIEPN